MRLFHLSDLHIGKRVNEFSMIEDQKYILERILDLAEKEMPDGVILAGDIYDKQIPSAEAVQVFDEFITKLAERKLAVLPDKETLVTRETIEGYIGFEPQGENGFGYDPIFYVDEYNCSTASLPPDKKNEMSHRGKALRAMKEALMGKGLS